MEERYDGGAKPHIVEEYAEDGSVKVHAFPSKSAAMKVGGQMRVTNGRVHVYAADSEWSHTAQKERMKAEREGRQPDIAGAVESAAAHTKSGGGVGAGGPGQSRDDHGRWDGTRPELHLAGPHDGGPTIDDIAKLFKSLSGRDASPAELAEAQAELDQIPKD